MTSGASDAERAWAVDVDETNFEAAVIEESGKIPVIVDFWAEWCGPCRALEPVLEKVARRYAGSIVVARANVDRVQRLAATLQIRSIPTLLAFRDGKAVEEIVGVVPEPELREFVERLLPTGADLMVREARSIEDEEPGRAEALYRSALETLSAQEAARLGLARLLVKRGADGEAEQVLGGALFTGDEEEEATRLRSVLSVRRKAAGFGDVASARARLDAAPGDAERHYELGCVLAAAGEYAEALDELLRAAEADRVLAREKVREAMVGVFHIIGVRTELANRYRDRLAGLLY